MIDNKRIAVVLPAYNAAKTLARVIDAIPRAIVDDIIVVDDFSSDETVDVARQLNVECKVHPSNSGYGANQKTCFRHALSRGNDVIVLLHPDYQYSPELVPALAHMVASGIYDVALGSRMLGKGALVGGMPPQVSDQQAAHSVSEHTARPTPVRVSYRLSRVFEGSLTCGAIRE